MEDYKTKYEKLIQRIDDLTVNGWIDEKAGKAILKDFTTLESKDERIRKALIESFKIHDLRALIIPGFSAKDVIDWLERVGKHNEQNFWEKCKHCEYFDGYDLCLHKKNFGSVTDESKENCKNNNFFIEKQVEQKLTDKVAPKFKVGDWITNGACTIQITSVDDTYYWHDNDCVGGDIESMDKEYHLWTIKDAKDGDVLAIKDIVFIFKHMDKTGLSLCMSYCEVIGNSKLGLGFDFSINDVHPATKEQRDFLSQKMKEFGYKWNAKKKELKKIEQKPAWSEEDEKLLKLSVENLTELKKRFGDGYGKVGDCIIWLKSFNLKHKLTQL